MVESKLGCNSVSGHGWDFVFENPCREHLKMLINIFFKDVFIYMGGGRWTGRERISRKLPAKCRAWVGAWFHDPEIITQAEIKSQDS